MLSVFCKFSRNNLQRITTREQLQAAFLLSFHSIRTPHDSSESEWTAWKKTPHTSTPLVQNVTSVDLATVKANPSSALGAFLVFQC
jgi:hypothetical protein